MLNFFKVQVPDLPAGYRMTRAAMVVEIRPDGLTKEEHKVLQLITLAARSKESMPALAIIGGRFQRSAAWALGQIGSLETLGKLRSVGVGRSRQVEITGTGLRTGPQSWVWRHMDSTAPEPQPV